MTLKCIGLPENSTEERNWLNTSVFGMFKAYLNMTPSCLLGGWWTAWRMGCLWLCIGFCSPVDPGRVSQLGLWGNKLPHIFLLLWLPNSILIFWTTWGYLMCYGSLGINWVSSIEEGVLLAMHRSVWWLLGAQRLDCSVGCCKHVPSITQPGGC